MIRPLVQTTHDETCYHGLRMAADEYIAIGETQIRYELIDGVVVMSPSPSIVHQRVIARLIAEITIFLDANPIGEVYPEIDVNLSAALGSNTVYRPDVVYLRRERVQESPERINCAPDLVVEVISPDSRKYDGVTKKNDYEAAGVGEYWLVDPLKSRMNFFVRQGEKFAESTPDGDTFDSIAIPGFTLDLNRIRLLFKTTAK